jgi:hypothetical protein
LKPLTLAGESMFPSSTAVTDEAVRAELQTALTSHTFARAHSLSNLLRYLCEKRLRGEADQLKEYTIAVEAYGRAADFQKKEDSIVRVEIKRLREKLRHYYATEGADHQIQITIPVGQYVPNFLHRMTAPQPASAENAQGKDVTSEEQTPPDPTEISAMHPKEEMEASAPFVEARPLRRLNQWNVLWVGGIAVLVLAASPWDWGLFRAKNYLNSTPHLETEARGGVAAGKSSVTNSEAPRAETDEIRIRAGITNVKYTDNAGRVWQGDRYFNGGNPLKMPKPMIYRTLDPELYQAGRQGDFTYHIPLKPGVYELRLHFAETVYGVDEPLGGGEASRMFAVKCNDQPLLPLMDILSEADGARTAEIKVFKDIRPAADGLLHLQFYSWAIGKALVNALEILPSQPGAIRPIRFTAHDKSVFTSDGREWMPDGYFKGGRTLARVGNVIGTNQPELYEAERFGHFSYAISVAPGRYSVTLHFAERYFGAANSPVSHKGIGSRVFNVFCNNDALLKNFDIFKEAGGNGRALTKRFSGLRPNAQGKLLLEFEPVENYPLVNAIEVIDENWQ